MVELLACKGNKTVLNLWGKRELRPKFEHISGSKGGESQWMIIRTEHPEERQNPPGRQKSKDRSDLSVPLTTAWMLKVDW